MATFSPKPGEYCGAVELRHTEKPGVHGTIWRNPFAGPDLAAQAGVQTLYESAQRSLAVYRDRACVGWRPIDATGEAGDYVWMSYAECWERAIHFASGLRGLNLCPGNNPDFKGGMLGFYAKNRLEWSIGMRACYRQGIVGVPFYDTLGPDAVQYVIGQTQVSTVCATCDVAVNVAKAAALGGCCISTIVLMDTDAVPPALLREVAAAAPTIAVCTWADVERAGAASVVAPQPPSPDDVAYFCYTSGTTGNPKGALITHKNMMTCLSGLLNSPGTNQIVRDEQPARAEPAPVHRASA